LGLRVECDPVFKDKFSRDLVLALFSSTLAQPQPDWPIQTLQPGFVFYEPSLISDWIRQTYWLCPMRLIRGYFRTRRQLCIKAALELRGRRCVRAVHS
jgi:hypothetical protein